LTWLTRARLPCSGASPEENLTLRSRAGVKDSGIIAEGRSLALFSESMSALADMLMCVTSRRFLGRWFEPWESECIFVEVDALM
jgi:hypothetical protein